jgi:hypothetical protein
MKSCMLPKQMSPLCSVLSDTPAMTAANTARINESLVIVTREDMVTLVVIHGVAMQVYRVTGKKYEQISAAKIFGQKFVYAKM